MMQQSIDFLQEKEPSRVADLELLKKIDYSMENVKFAKEETILSEGEKLKGIYLIRSGIVNVLMRSSLIDEYNFQRIYPGCSYGTYSFFVDDEST